MKTQPKRLKRAIIKEELIALTDDWLTAVILNQFLYWSERTRDSDKFIEEEKERSDEELKIEPQHGWIYKSADQLNDELMVSVSPTTIRRRIKTLVEKGWLEERRNPKYKWDRTFQYRPDIIKITTDLHALGYALEGYPLQLEIPTCTTQDGSSTTTDQNPTGDGAVPETTTETTTKKEHADNSRPTDKESEIEESEQKPLTLQELKARLEQHFVEVSGLPPPPLKTDKQRRAAGALWYGSLVEIADVCDRDPERTEKLIDWAIAYMQEEKLTIRSPKSIAAVAVGEQARRLREAGLTKPLQSNEPKREVLSDEQGEEFRRQMLIKAKAKREREKEAVPVA